MIKKFFSIILLTTTLAVSCLFSKTVTLKNNTSQNVSNITFSYSTSKFESSDICSKILHSGQEGVSELEDTTIISIDKITYTITTPDSTTNFTYDFEGKEIGLPAVILLSDKPDTRLIIHDNEEVRIEANKNKIVNQVAAAAHSAKDNLENALTATKDWAISATKRVTTTAQDVVHKAKIVTNATAQKIAKATNNVQDEGTEFRAATQQASDIIDATNNPMLHTKHTIQEKAQELGDSTVESVLETYNTSKEIVSKIEHKIEDVKA